ncbi:3-isopropylmalate dehydrogenase [Bacillus sp. JJ664]
MSSNVIIISILLANILCVNSFAFFIYRKSKNLYLSAFIIFALACILAIVEGIIAVMIIQDGFAFFFGLNIVGYYLIINSLIVFLLAILVSIVKFFKRLN